MWTTKYDINECSIYIYVYTQSFCIIAAAAALAYIQKTKLFVRAVSPRRHLAIWIHDVSKFDSYYSDIT